MNNYFPFFADSYGSIDWQTLANNYPWISDLKGVPQNPVYHAEGDVFVHTQMVVEELCKLNSYQKLKHEEKVILFASAFMHDIGKAFCTINENGNITSPSHAKKGAQLARRLMFRGIPQPIPFKARETIYQLIRHHGLPLWFWDKPNPAQRLITLSQSLNLSQLTMLAEADVRGRICNDQQELLERVALFQEFSIEQNCASLPYPFEHGLHRFSYCNNHDTNASPVYIPFDNTEFEVIMLCGLPGVGKNTWIEAHAPDMPVISLDTIRREMKISPKDNQGRVLQESKERAKVLLRKKHPFIWNATNILQQRRKQLVELFTTYKARVKIVYLEVPYKTLLERNQNRKYALPTNVLERFIGKLQVPEVHEAHEVVYWE